MIEALLSPKEAIRSPWKLFGLAAVFVTIGIAVSIYVPSILGGPVILAMVPSIPLLWTLIVREEHHDEDLKLLEQRSFEYHMPLLRIFTFFFLGAVVAYAFWYAVLPADQSAVVFDSQLREIGLIRGVATASATGRAINADFAIRLAGHNLQVLLFMFVFCLLYGMGSVYLLLWNASIIGVFVGTRFAGAPGYAIATFLGILPHGIFEIGAYFVASIAGGILSAAIMRRHFEQREFPFVVRNISMLTIIAVAMIIVGALLEGMA